MQKIQRWFRFFPFQNCIILFLISLFCVFFIVRSEPDVTIRCDWVIAAGGRRSLGAPAPPLWLGSIVLMMVVAQQRQHIVSSAVRRATWDQSYYIGRRRSGQKQRKLCVAHRPTGAAISQTHFFSPFSYSCFCRILFIFLTGSTSASWVVSALSRHLTFCLFSVKARTLNFDSDPTANQTCTANLIMNAVAYK